MVRVFIDFDGTITREDVGDAMFERFGGERCRTIVAEYRQGQLSAVDCFRRESEACGIVEIDSLNMFLDRCEIDRTFIDFVSFCDLNGLVSCILSDGMDYYIRWILERHGLGHVQTFSNVLRFEETGEQGKARFRPEFPYRDEVCDRCACCKRNHLATLSADDDIIVYVGEGYSDRCPAGYADIVFAKDELLTYCQSANISFFEYVTFADITERLGKLLSQKDAKGKYAGLRKRRQAELARQQLFMGE